MLAADAPARHPAARVRRALLVGAIVVAAMCGWDDAARGTPIPSVGSAPAFVGAPATPDPMAAPALPQHPFLAPNERSNIHDDAYQSDTYRGYGPLGHGGVTTTSTLLASECASVTFDARGRIVAVCVGIVDVTLRMLDPVTLATLASYPLPARSLLSGGSPFTNFSGGGYFYLDDQDRVVVPTADRHVLTIAETSPAGFRLVRDVDLSAVVPAGDSIISALPDWSGRVWAISKGGVVATIDRDTGAVKAIDTREGIGNSFAVDGDGSVSIVTDAALYRFEAGRDGTPVAVWREPYANIGRQKSGQSQPGSGTTPTLIGSKYVAITDNADPMDVLVYQRGRTFTGRSRLTCKLPVFAKGASSTDQSLIGTPGLIVVENNYGYSSPLSVELGQTTTPGLEGIRLRADGSCEKAWTSGETAPSVVPKLSLAGGLVYTYTKPKAAADPWYLTALDARTGKTVFEALAGFGLGFNNNYAPVTLGPDGAAYVGVLGGLVRFKDRDPSPPLPVPPRRVKARRVALRVACRRHRPRATVTGSHIRDVRVRVAGVRGARRDRRRPFALTLRGRPRASVAATVRFADGRKRRTLHARLPRCSGSPR